MTMMLVNLPVTDLERAKAFYTAIGFTINPLFTDHNAACVFVEEDHSAIMLLDPRVLPDLHRPADRRPGGEPVGGDRRSTSTAGRRSTRPSPPALAAGGSEPHPAADYGFMYQRQLNDPDGNILEFGYMDPVAAAQGPEAFASQQA